VPKKASEARLQPRLLCFFCKTEYGINSILFQRGIYPAEDFDNTQQYGLTILMSKDPKIQTFLQNVLSQTEGKVISGKH